MYSPPPRSQHLGPPASVPLPQPGAGPALRPCPSPASGGLAGPRRVSFSCETPTALRGVSHEAFPPCELGTLTPSRVLSHAALEDWAGPGERRAGPGRQ